MNINHHMTTVDSKPIWTVFKTVKYDAVGPQDLSAVYTVHVSREAAEVCGIEYD